MRKRLVDLPAQPPRGVDDMQAMQAREPGQAGECDELTGGFDQEQLREVRERRKRVTPVRPRGGVEALTQDEACEVGRELSQPGGIVSCGPGKELEVVASAESISGRGAGVQRLMECSSSQPVGAIVYP